MQSSIYIYQYFIYTPVVKSLHKNFIKKAWHPLTENDRAVLSFRYNSLSQYLVKYICQYIYTYTYIYTHKSIYIYIYYKL